MFETIAGILIAFFVIIGITELLHSAAGFFLKRPDGRVRFLVTSLGHDEQLEYTIRSLIHAADKNYSMRSNPLIIIIDNGMDAETKKTCEILSKELGCIEICLPEQLPSMLRQNFQI